MTNFETSKVKFDTTYRKQEIEYIKWLDFETKEELIQDLDIDFARFINNDIRLTNLHYLRINSHLLAEWSEWIQHTWSINRTRVAIVQNALKSRWYDFSATDDFDIDGHYWPDTFLNVCKFQADKWLEVDWILWKKTLYKLFRANKREPLWSGEEGKLSSESNKNLEAWREKMWKMFDSIWRSMEDLEKDVSKQEEKIWIVLALLEDSQPSIITEKYWYMLNGSDDEMIQEVKKWLDDSWMKMVNGEKWMQIDKMESKNAWELFSKLEKQMNMIGGKKGDKKMSIDWALEWTEETMKKAEIINKLEKFQKSLGERGLDKMSQSVKGLIREINDEWSNLSKWYAAFEKVLVHLESFLEGEISLQELYNIFSKSWDLIGVIEKSLKEILPGAINFVIAFLEDISIYIFWVTEVNDYKNGIIVWKAKTIRDEYSTGLSFIDGPKDYLSNNLILKASTLRWAETAIFDSIKWIANVNIKWILESIIDNLPKILDILEKQFKDIFAVLWDLEAEDFAYLVWYMATLVFFPVKDYSKYFKKYSLSSIITRVTKWTKFGNVLKQSQNIQKTLKDLEKKLTRDDIFGNIAKQIPKKARDALNTALTNTWAAYNQAQEVSGNAG